MMNTVSYINGNILSRVQRVWADSPEGDGENIANGVTITKEEYAQKTKEAVADAIGAYINVRTYKAIDNQKEFEGHLTKFEDDVMTLEVLVKTRKKTVEIPYDMASKVRLAIKF
ncbi:MAG: hypothetical protein IJD87_06130 [Turicibacter sp.]|nr:hypothetical protein [Turicibacter sp.]